MSTRNARRSSSPSARRLKRRPRLEALEGRALLTTFVVNSTSDVLNPPPGVVTLRSAIEASNANPDPTNGNLIEFKTPGVYKITLPGAGTGTNNSGAFAILPSGGNLVIENLSKGAVTIDGNSIDRVFDINPVANPSSSAPFSVTIQSVTIQNGVTTSTDPTAGSGGGVRVQGSALLTLENDVVVNNASAANGGGVAMLNGTSQVPILSIQDSQILNNTATAGAGGGVYAPGPGIISQVTNTLIKGNSAHDGGGIEDPGSNLSLQNVTLDSNHAVGGNGGGLDVTNPSGAGSVQAYVSDSLFINNGADGGSGGAIGHSAGALIVAGSQFSGDHAGAGGAVASSGTSLTVSASTFTGDTTGSGDGGALALSDAGTDALGDGSQVLNSTFTLNTAAGRGGAIADAGPGDLALVNDTINVNTSGAAGGGVALTGTPSGTLDVLNTVLFLNVNNSATGPDVATLNGSTVTDQGGNLVGTRNQGNTGFGAGTLSADPLLGPLGDYGGPLVGANNTGLANYQRVIQTEAPASNSPAIGKGVVSASYGGVDERGSARPATATNPTIGAVEPQQRPSLDYVLGSDQNLRTRELTSSGLPAGPYYVPDFGQALDLAATRFGTGLAAGVESFVIGGDNQVYAQTIDPSNNQRGFLNTAGGVISSISAGTTKAGNPLLFAVGADHQLYELKFDANGNPLGGGSYTKAAFGDFKSTVLTHDAAGNPLLYAVSDDADSNQVYGLKLQADGTPNGKLFKVANGQVKELIVGHDASNNPEIFVSDAVGDLELHKLLSDGTPTGPYVGVGGPVSSISVSYNSANMPIVFGIGGDGNVYEHKFDAGGNSSGGFTAVSASAVPGGALSIVAGADAGGNPELFAISKTNSQVYVAPFDPNGNSTGPFTLVSTGQVKKLVLA